MGATFSRLKNWTAEILTYADLNAEIDNILNNLTPGGADDYSTNTTQMRISTDPGEDGTESLATSLAGEIERIRFAIEEMKGTTYWYETAGNTINGLNDLIATDTPSTRLVSGKTVSSSDSQTIFLVPNGSAATVTLDASPTNLVYVISGTQYTISADTDIDSLLTAPAANNTALVNESTITADEEESKTLGENGTVINIDNAGSEITSRDGQYAAFSITNGTDTEYFIAKVDGTTLKDARRGYFFNSSSAAVDRIGFSDNDTITLLKLTWIYANSAGSLVVSYNNPTYSGDEPSSPAVGDYWFDQTNNVWKTFDSVSWNTTAVVPIGVCAQDTSNCIAARAFDLYKNHSDLNNIRLEHISNTVVSGRELGATVTVNSNPIRYSHDVPTWDITANLQSGVSEAASTTYYLYIDEFGDEFISDIAPYRREGDLKGRYHPHKMWRAVGQFFNNASGNITNVQAYFQDPETLTESIVPPGTISAYGGTTAPLGYLLCNGDSVSRITYRKLFAAIGTAFGDVGGSSTEFKIPNLQGYFLRGVDGGTGTDPDAASRTALNPGGNTGDNVGSVQSDDYKAHTHNYLNAVVAGSTINNGSPNTGGVGATTTSPTTGGNETRPKNVYVNYIIKY